MKRWQCVDCGEFKYYPHGKPPFCGAGCGSTNIIPAAEPTRAFFRFLDGENYSCAVDLDLTINGLHRVWLCVPNDNLGPGGGKPDPEYKDMEIFDKGSDAWKHAVERATAAHRRDRAVVSRALVEHYEANT